MKKYILFITIIFISCEHHISNVDKKNYNYGIDSTTLIHRQISCNNQNDKKTRVNTNIYSI